ncbi:hypothetical protein D3C81_1244120 [compost metagenome]
MAQRMPLGQLAARLVEHPVPDRHDGAGLLRQRDELVRHQLAVCGMVPAQQRLRADQLAAHGGELGLIVQF